MNNWVLDASAVLALLHLEPGAETVSQLMKSEPCAISAVNLAEVAARLSDRGVPAEVVQESLAALEISVIAFDASHAFRSGELRETTRHLGLSLGDRACLASALGENAKVLTADRPWALLNLGLDIQLIR